MVSETIKRDFKRSAVLDSSSAIILFKSGIFNKVSSLLSLFISDSVYREISQKDHRGSDFFSWCVEHGVLQIKNPLFSNLEDPILKPGDDSLGDGERDTIILFIYGVGDFIIIDDRKGASFCRNNDLKFINALLLPRILFLAGLSSLEECNRDTNIIINFGRYSRWVIDYAAACADDKLRWYIQG